jgi:hypothetical protein
MSNQAPAQPISATMLTNMLSSARLEAYRLLPSDTHRMLLGRYRWNVALCMSLYPVLGYLEVAFRNSIHRALTGILGTPAWFDVSPHALKPDEQDVIATAKKALRQRGVAVEPDRMVAELSFGFWTGLLRTEYEQVLWPRLLATVFPGMPRRHRTRSAVSARMHMVRRLRNRVFHHEPIWRLQFLTQRHDELRDTLMWFDRDLLRLFPSAHTFEEIHAQGPTTHEQDVQ